ncbi:MAG: HEPN domain-containing protein [Cyanobacteria bacterium J06623_4]
MSVAKLQKEAERWFEQAEDDLSAALALLSANKFSQACFLSQQAAEKSLMAVGYRLDIDPWGHSCTKLIRGFPEEERQSFMEVEDDAKALDKLYIPTRYPDALAELTPADAFTEKEAIGAIASAQSILNRAKNIIYPSSNPPEADGS